MAEHGILFSAPMVRALLNKRKTVTRRLSERWLKVKAGDILWVRETLRVADSDQGSDPEFLGQFIQYAADGAMRGWTHDQDGLDTLYPFNGLTVPSIHMPRWASRITLIATEDARRERLQDITEVDAKAEGVEGAFRPSGRFDNVDLYGDLRYVDPFRELWDSLHGKTDPWESNPMVVRLGFEVTNG